MPLESATYIDGLVSTNPPGTDLRTSADDHLRLIKAVLKASFPNINAAVTATPDLLNALASLNYTPLHVQAARPAEADCTAGDVWIDSDHDVNEWASYLIVDPADDTKDTLLSIIDTSNGIEYPVAHRRSVTITPSADSDESVSAADAASGWLELEDGSWASGHAILLPSGFNGAVYVDNSNGTYDAEVKISGGTGVSVPSGQWRIVLLNGTDAAQPITVPEGLSAQGVLAPHENLVVKNNTTNPNYQIDVTIDEVELTDDSGNKKKFTNVSLTLDITSAGAKNGLGSGLTEASSTDYEIFIGEDSGVPYGWLDTDAAGANDPDNTSSYKGFVGVIPNDGSSNFLSLTQKNCLATLDIAQTDATGKNETSYTAAVVSIPVKATAWKGWIEEDDNAGGVAYCSIASNSSGACSQPLRQAGYSGAATVLHNPAWQPIIESQTIYYLVVSGSGSNLAIKTNAWGFF
jgi:hypothetical protein